MITTLTLSPCIDKTVILNGFDPDKVNRAEGTRLDPGGKGINVSLALASLGVESSAIVLGFEGSEIAAKALCDARAGCELVKCDGRLRTNLKIFDRATGRTIEINEQNPTVSQNTVSRLMELCLKYAGKSDIFVLSGSLPPGIPADIYQKIAASVRRENPDLKIILDAEGEALLKGISAAPYMIKPNVSELERSFGTSLSSDNDIISLSRRIIADHGAAVVLVSKGADGAIAVTRSLALRSDALRISPKSAQGAGDAMVAWACLAISRGLDADGILRYGIAASAGAVELEGTSFCKLERFEELLAAVQTV